jgi:predicted enzyme related to lactoylglutathione lyase
VTTAPLVLDALCIDANDPPRLAHFWATALRWDVGDVSDGGEVRLVPLDGTRIRLEFRPVAAPKVEKNPIHLDLTTTSLDDQAESVDALLALGARHVDVGQTAADEHVVLADPEGNEFCLIEPQNNFLATCGRFGSITCDGSPAVGRFWSAALSWPLVWDQDEETAIRAPDGTGPFVTWGPPVPARGTRNRLRLHVASTAPDRREAIDELVALGATESAVELDGTVLMTDPDGLEFRLLRAR